MLRFATIFWIVVWVSAAFGLYMVKYRVQAVKQEVMVAERELHKEKQALHVLNAEWSYLTRPERLRELSTKYLDARPASGQQLADYSNVPLKTVMSAALAEDDMQGISRVSYSGDDVHE